MIDGLVIEPEQVELQVDVGGVCGCDVFEKCFHEYTKLNFLWNCKTKQWSKGGFLLSGPNAAQCLELLVSTPHLLWRSQSDFQNHRIIDQFYCGWREKLNVTGF